MRSRVRSRGSRMVKSRVIKDGDEVGVEAKDC